VNDTPRTDAQPQLIPSDIEDAWKHNAPMVDVDFARQLERELTLEKRHTEAVMRTLKDALGIEDGRDCLEEVGRLKEVEAQHRILTLIAERDSARTQADRKWRLREEFEALLGTSDVKLGMFKIKQLKHALSMADPRCDHLHHPKKHQHKITEPCPVEELIRKAQKI